MLIFNIFTVIFIYLMIRLNQVGNFRLKLINEIGKQNIIAINNDKSYLCNERWKYFDSVSFDEMLFKCWIDINDFYNMDKFEFEERENF